MSYVAGLAPLSQLPRGIGTAVSHLESGTKRALAHLRPPVKTAAPTPRPRRGALERASAMAEDEKDDNDDGDDY